MKTYDVSPDLPGITNQDVDEWLAGAVKSGRSAYNLQWSKYQAVQSGDLPVEAFDAKQFDSLKRTLAITEHLRKLFDGVFGSPPGEPAEDVDEQFFSILSNLYGYDVTKGRKQ